MKRNQRNQGFVVAPILLGLALFFAAGYIGERTHPELAAEQATAAGWDR